MTSRSYTFGVSHYCNAVTAKCYDAMHLQLRTIAMPHRYSIVISRHRDVAQLGHRSMNMKKNRDASELAARIAAAARQPAGMSSAPAALVSPQSAAEATFTSPASPRRKREKADVPDTVPITLRPNSALLNKYVMKASERTREEGRVVSAQQIMLEALERGDL